MNILILDHYAGGPDLGAEYRSYYLAKHWQEQGHTVRIMAGEYSHLRSHNPKLTTRTQKQMVEGLDYRFISTPRYNESVTGRGRNIAFFLGYLWKSAEHIAADFNPDIILSASGYPFEIYAARRIAKFSGATLITQVKELWPLIYKHQFHCGDGHPAVRAISHAQRQAMTLSDHVVTLQPHGFEYLSKFGLKSQRWSCIPSGILTQGHRGPTTSPAAEELSAQKKQGKTVVMYCGSIGVNHDLRHFVESGALVGSDVVLVIVGNGGHKIALKRIATEMSSTNVLFLDRPPKARMLGLIQQADCIFYSPPLFGELHKYGMASTNLLGYMLSGKPVICDTPAPDHPVTLCDGGVVLSSRDPREVAGGIRLLAELSPKEREDMGRRGADYVKKHCDYNLLATSYLELMEKLQGKKSVDN